MSCPEELKPSSAILKSSFRSRAVEYPRVAALHGVSYVADTSRPVKERICWLFIILASILAMLAIIATLMVRFQTDPMLDSIEVSRNEGSIPLPRIYLCPQWELFIKQPLPDTIDETLDKRESRVLVKKIGTRGNASDDSSLLLSTIFKRNPPPCDQFIHNSTLNGIQLSCSSFERVWTPAGNCFLVPSLGIVIKNIEILFSFKTTTYPTRVYVTLSEEEVFLRHLPYHVFVFPFRLSMEFQETLTSQYAKILSKSQRNCFFPGEQLSYVKCASKCHVKNSLEYCNCVPWYLAILDGDTECPKSRYDCLEKNERKILDISRCRCRQSCDNLVFAKKRPEVRPPNEACEIKIVGWFTLRYMRTVRFGFIDLFISFGGIAGLFLGCSLISTIEFGYYFTLRSYCGAVLEAPKRSYIIAKINVLDTRQPVDFRKTRKRRFAVKKIDPLHDYIN